MLKAEEQMEIVVLKKRASVRCHGRQGGRATRSGSSSRHRSLLDGLLLDEWPKLPAPTLADP